MKKCSTLLIIKNPFLKLSSWQRPENLLILCGEGVKKPVFSYFSYGCVSSIVFWGARKSFYLLKLKMHIPLGQEILCN